MIQSFNTLSVELIAEILCYLDYHDLLRCCRVAKNVKNIISNTIALKYKVELGMTGNQDGSSSISIPERLAQLRLLQRSWEAPKPTYLHTITVPSQSWSHSKWQKDVFFGRRPSADDKKRLEVFNIGAAYHNKERLQDFSFDIIFDAYAVDFDQDLIALVRSTHTDDAGRKISPRVYLRSFKDQTPHYRAQHALFDLGLYGMMDLKTSWVLRPRVQIAGEYLLLTLFRSLPVESIIVWHWPSGTLKALLYFSQDDGCVNAMCTDSGHLLLAKRPARSAGRFGIFVYALEDERTRLLATFELPRLKWDFRASLTASFSPREHTCGALNGGLASFKTPFAPASVLVQFQWDRQYTLYTPLVTFLSREVLDSGRRSLGPLYFPWDKWGPHRSRLMIEGTTTADICGYRAIFPDHILDFSPATLRNADPDSLTRATIIQEPNTVAGPMFAEPVVTSLPYCRISFELPPAPGAARNTRNQMYRTFVDIDGPKLLRVTCDDFILVPSSIEVFSLMEQDDHPGRPDNDAESNSSHSSPTCHRDFNSIIP